MVERRAVNKIAALDGNVKVKIGLIAGNLTPPWDMAIRSQDPLDKNYLMGKVQRLGEYTLERPMPKAMLW